VSGDGDGWVICAAGHQHWGRFGAAGLLISDGTRAILQHRAPWTHEGGTWALPGGARDSHEDPVTTALREAGEEAAIGAASVEPTAMSVEDHGGWSYTTVLARPAEPITPRAANAESTDVRWWTVAEIDALPLHHGFAATWPRVRSAPTPLSVVVDARSDPRFAASLAGAGIDRDRVDSFVRLGVPIGLLPDGFMADGVSSLIARITLVGIGVPPVIRTVEDGRAGWWRRAAGFTSVASAADVTADIARAVAAGAGSHQTVVVTADGSLRASFAVAAGVSVVTPQWLADQLEPAPAG
jgi:8-oxo-dGTP pyrophosphatase MutT (NUDIX family)